MTRKVYLEGALGDRYGREFDMAVDTFGDAFKLLQANFSDFKHFLVECDEKNLGFTCQYGDSFIDDEDDLLTPIEKGDLIISAVPVGSKSGMGKIFAALAIAALFLIPGTAPAALALTKGSIAFNIVSGIAINLALAGFQQLMAPDPSVDEEEPQSYLFNGSDQNIQEGDPVPLLYGELRVPGRMVSFGTIVAAYGVSGVTGPVKHGYAVGDGNGVVEWEIE